MQPSWLETLNQNRIPGRKQLAILIDPDKASRERLEHLCRLAAQAPVAAFLVGGSLIHQGRIEQTIHILKGASGLPVILFPGNPAQVTPAADAILLLSLISGRNPELLIGAHIAAAPVLKDSGLEIIPTGYILVESGRLTTVHYISQTIPVPHDKPEVAAVTAMAGEMLGLRLIYLDAGSGAIHPVSADMIRSVRNAVDTPLVVGGGIRNGNAARTAFQAGADIVVVGNALECDNGEALFMELSASAVSCSQTIR